jgi:hypothetical protein
VFKPSCCLCAGKANEYIEQHVLRLDSSYADIKAVVLNENSIKVFLNNDDYVMADMIGRNNPLLTAIGSTSVICANKDYPQGDEGGLVGGDEVDTSPPIPQKFEYCYIYNNKNELISTYAAPKFDVDYSRVQYSPSIHELIKKIEAGGMTK